MPREFQTPDGLINETSSLLGNVSAYSYGPNDERPSTQTSYINHPHRIQKVIPKMFLPGGSAEVGIASVGLEHALHDGDLTFTLRMPKEMITGPSEFCQARNVPGRTLAQLVNLATVNYILWGLQVGREKGTVRNNKWQDFFLRLSQGTIKHSRKVADEQAVWAFLETFLRPFGVMVGSDMQGGQHEGGAGRIATYPVDYVASFLIDGKCRKLNNAWRHINIAAGDDLVLVLKRTQAHERSIVHVLTSGARAYREERTYSERDWYFLCPAICKPSTMQQPHIHIGRSQGMYSAYNVGMGMGRSPWDARASILGQGVQVTFAPEFYTPRRLRRGRFSQHAQAPAGENQPLGATDGSVVVALASTSAAVSAVHSSGAAFTSTSGDARSAKRQRRRKEVVPTFAQFEAGDSQPEGREGSSLPEDANSERGDS